MSRKRHILLVLILLSLATLACRFSLELPWDIGPADVAISPDDVAAAATRASIAAATAAALADQAGQLAATAVLEGDNIVSTAVAGEGLGAVGTALSSLEQKLIAIRPDANGNFTITFTDADLASYLATQGGAFANDEARIENVQVRMLPQHVEIRGDLTQPLAVSLTAQLRPVVSDGRLYFQVINASAGVLPIPDSMIQLLEAGVNSGLGQAMNALPANVILQDVALGNGSMTVLGRMN